MKMFDKIMSHSLINHGAVSILANELSWNLKAHVILESATPVPLPVAYKVGVPIYL